MAGSAIFGDGKEGRWGCKILGTVIVERLLQRERSFIS